MSMSQTEAVSLKPTPLDNDVAVEIVGMHKWYGSFHVLRDINLRVDGGERIVVCGPSGSGKSTMIRCINRLEEHQQGRIVVDGVELTNDLKKIDEIRRDVGMVFQHFNLFPHMTALQNCMEGPVQVLGLSKQEAEARAVDLLQMVGLDDKKDQHPARLSGGQQQRVAIARALAMRPKVLLLDEVTSALEPVVIGEVLNVIRKLNSEHNLTILMVTHQMGFAREISDRVCFFYGGRIAEAGLPSQIFGDPKNERTRQFLSAVLHAG
jgi:general L-amino acid transport system ATP-binding protein